MICRNLDSHNRAVFLGSVGRIRPTKVRLSIGLNNEMQEYYDFNYENGLHDTTDHYIRAENAEHYGLTVYASDIKIDDLKLTITWYVGNYSLPIQNFFVKVGFYYENELLMETDYFDQFLKYYDGYSMFEPTIISTTVCCKSIKMENYAERQNAVRCSLTQSLSVIKGELWYSHNYGIPLTDKNKSKSIFDAYAISIINKNPYVYSILEFKSLTDKHDYHLNAKIQSTFGEMILSI